MRLLKSIVTLLGLLIVGGVVLLAYGFYKKSTEPEWKLFGNSEYSPPPAISSPPRAKDQAPIPAFGDLTIKIPPGCFIRTARPQGNRLFITLAPRDTCSKIFVIDLTDGRMLGTISPAP